MNCVGIDVSKGKSTVAVMRPFGEVVIAPFEVLHTTSALSALAEQIKGLNGDTRVVMEHTGNYHMAIASTLHDAGIYVSAVNSMLVHRYGNNSIRQAKTDKKDAIKLANYGLDHWRTLPRYSPEEDTRLLLKSCNRQHEQYAKMETMLKNNLMALLEQTFPNVNRLFTSRRTTDGREKWVDFVAAFWHCECVSDLAETEFSICYHQWCRDNGYNFSQAKARQIYAAACECPHTMPKSDTVKLLVVQAVAQLKTAAEALSSLQKEMQTLSAVMPEYPVVMQMFGVGQVLGPQLIAEIGDVRRFHSKKLW